MTHHFSLSRLLFLAGLALAALHASAAAQDYPRIAPYSGIRWSAESLPEVEIEGRWHALLSIDKQSAESLIEFAKKRYAGLWLKRFNEDIVQVLSEAGHPPGETVALVLRNLETGKQVELAEVPLTEANRRAIMRSRPAATLTPAATPSRAELLQALDAFQSALDERWSYRRANDADFGAAIAALREAVESGLPANEFGIELQKVIALGIDGHAGVSGYELPGGYLPFLIEPTGERFVAFGPDRSGFLADGFPYVTHLDGKPIADWCAVAARLVPKGSPQYVRRHGLRYLRHLDWLRGELQLPRSEHVRVDLAAADGKARKQLTLAVASRSPTYGVWPRSESRVLDDDVGYLRLASMDAGDSVAEIEAWMPRFRDTIGLVVDVRDNGGGARDALRLLYSHLVAKGTPPRVFTAAAYRRHPSHGEDHLAQRFMYRADAEQWTAAERRAVAAFARSFKPKWELPEGQFSDWHYLALSRLDDPGIYHYRKPVVVLMNAKCFSATDIFLAGLEGLPNVTLLGTPSGGGSALSQTVALGQTPFRLRIGSMASFQSDGSLFDGHGVQPDVVVEAVPEYHVGGRDNALEEAIRRIRKR